MTANRHTTGSLTRAYLLACAGNAALLLLGWCWLYIPDAHAWQFFLAVLAAAVILAGFLALHVVVIRQLYPAPQRALLQACLLLLGWLMFGYILQHFLGLLGNRIDARAGNWNSRLDPHARAYFTYERLSHWQSLALEALTWIVVPGLLLPFAVETVQHSLKPWRAALATLARPELWLAVAAAYIGGTCAGKGLMEWHPAHSVHGELVSLAVRSALAYCLTVGLLVGTLLVVSLLLVRFHERRDPAA